MGSIKIPFGWHAAERKWKDPGSVPSGLACGCYCHKCKELLQAVHPRRLWRAKWVEKFFRHAKGTICKGALESLAHKMAKELLERHSSVFLPDSSEFFYDSCEVEAPLEGKRADVYLINSRTGERLVIEIFYNHRMEENTLAAFREKGIRVMQIDISSTRTTFTSMEDFERMVLKEAPREFLWVPEVEVAVASVPLYNWELANSPAPVTWAQRILDWWEENWLLVVLLIVGLFVGYRVYRLFSPKTVIARRGRRR